MTASYFYILGSKRFILPAIRHGTWRSRADYETFFSQRLVTLPLRAKAASRWFPFHSSLSADGAPVKVIKCKVSINRSHNEHC